VRPTEQLSAHAPALQTVPFRHALPQVPQFNPSPTVLVQPVSHAVRFAWHVQLPVTQLDPTAQALPQVPQLVALLDRSTQKPLQAV
jgi:hypothetical protein